MILGLPLRVLRAVVLVALTSSFVVPSALAQNAPSVVTVVLTNDGCTPSTASVNAGPVTFNIANNGGDRVTEVELLRDDLIIGEKENLAPGLSGSFSVNLAAGTYDLYCPGATTEKTRFTVTQRAGAQPINTSNPAAAAAFTQATTQYRTYVRQEVDALLFQTRALVFAISQGDIDGAKAAYPRARTHYEAIEPVAESFGNLDPAIDMREDDVTDSSLFTGFHRIEKALWMDGNLNGMNTVAQNLLTDVQHLQTLVNDPNSFKFDAAAIANGSTELLDEVAHTKLTGEEELYSKLDLLDMAANVAGSRKGFDLLAPGLRLIDPVLTDTITSRFNALDAAMAPFKVDDGWVTYDQLGPNDIRALTQAVNDVAEPLSKVAGLVVAVR